MKPSYEELEARCAALAAENAGLKAAISSIHQELCGQGFEVAGWHLNGDLQPLDSWFEENNWNPETPATDAYLAEVRAEHLQSYADSIAARMKDKSLSMRQKERLNFAWAEAKSYAAELHNAQLRKGVQS